MEDMQNAQREAEIAQERTIKALNNEKAVLRSSIEARDGKIEVLSSQITELEERASKQSEQLASIESLKNNLEQSQKKCSSAESVIAEMKKAETELHQDLKNAKGIVIDLDDKFRAAKESASKCESDCRKLKMERASLKNKAEGRERELMRISKEMSRMNSSESKSNSDALEMNNKLKTDLEELRRENSDMQEQLQKLMRENSVLNEQLEATCLAHQQSVSYQLSVDGNAGASSASEQRISELESVISSLTEHMNAKEMQIDTLKQINQALIKEINEGGASSDSTK